MSNPWAQSFEELRSPYLQEKMAKKDYDGDGKIETGTQEYMGSRDKAIKKAMGKKVEDKKKVAEHHQKDANGNTIPHEDEGDGTPSSVEEMVNKKFGSGGDPTKKSGFLDKALDKLKNNTPVKKVEKAHYEPEGEVIEAKIDKIDPKNKRKRRNEVSFGKQTKPYDPPGKAYKNEMGKFLQKQRKEKHDKDRGTTYKRPKAASSKYEEFVLEADKKGKGSGTKDACYHKVKSRYSVWPSAYASGALVKCRKAGAKNWGNSSKKEEFDYYQMPMKSFGDMVGECWKTHKQVGTKMKGGKVVPNCVPKNEEAQIDEILDKDSQGRMKLSAADVRLNSGAYRKSLKDINNKVYSPIIKQVNHYEPEGQVIEAVKNPKLDVKETGVKNKIEINPEIKTEEAKASAKK